MSAKKKNPSPLEILSGKSSEKKDEKKEPSSKKRKFSETHIRHHDDGSHTVRHTSLEKPEGPGESSEVSYARPDLAGVIAGLKQHIAEEEAGEEK